MSVDPFKVAQADKSKPLRVFANASGFVCVLCGAEQEGHAWRVTLPDRLGRACPNCAVDRGWTVR